MRIEIRARDLPGRTHPGGYADVHVGVQRGKEVVERVPADAEAATWTFDVTDVARPDGASDVRGPFVHGRPGERFLYLCWSSGSSFAGFRRAKLMLDDPDLLRRAAGRTLVGELGLTARDGTAVCASVRPPAITWTVTG